MALRREVLPAASVVRSLAAAQWGEAAPIDVRLDLRYAPDEDSLLEPTPSAIWEDVIRQSQRFGAALVSHYPVTDPYGAERGAPVVSKFFAVPIDASQLVFGAGVTSLLHDLSRLALGGIVVAPASVHSDLEVWASAAGSRVCLIPDSTPAKRIEAEIVAAPGALLHLDRPTFTGELLPLNALERIANAAARGGSIVIVDEGPATYLGPKASAVTLIPRTANLIVLRGFTKAYSLGGLRAGFAVASSRIGSRLRAHVVPLQMSELALAMALKVLEAGDIFGRLVRRIREIKPIVADVLGRAGFPVIRGHPDLPWVAFHDENHECSSRLARRGIRVLTPTTTRAFPGAGAAVARVTIPLWTERLEHFRDLVAADTDPLRTIHSGGERHELRTRPGYRSASG